MLRTALVALSLVAFPVAALAHSCPSVMAEIDAALPAATLSEADMTKVKELRARGEEEHAAGNHDASMATLAEAKTLLGL